MTIEFTSPLTVGSPAALPRNVEFAQRRRQDGPKSSSPLARRSGRGEPTTASSSTCWTLPHRRPHRAQTTTPAVAPSTVSSPPAAAVDPGPKDQGETTLPPERSGRDSGAARRGAIARLSRKDPMPHLRPSRRPPSVRRRCPPARCPDRSALVRAERSNRRPAAPDGPSPCRSSRPSGRRLSPGRVRAGGVRRAAAARSRAHCRQIRCSVGRGPASSRASTVIRVPAPPGRGTAACSAPRTAGSSHRGRPLGPKSLNPRVGRTAGSTAAGRRPGAGRHHRPIPTPARMCWSARCARPGRASPPPGGRAEFALLPTWQGVAVEPLSDRLALTAVAQTGSCCPALPRPGSL